MKKSVQERLEDLQSKNLSKKDALNILYSERYPMFDITETLRMSSTELQELNEDLNLSLSRCPVGHKFFSNPALHTDDAHYCVECQRWFNGATLRDEIELEIRRLKEKEQR